MSEIKINKSEDRLTVAKILVDNGYTVRQTRRRRGKTNSYDYLIEYWPNTGVAPEKGAANEGLVHYPRRTKG